MNGNQELKEDQNAVQGASPVTGTRKGGLPRKQKFEDLTGRVFGRWTVNACGGMVGKTARQAWDCLCSCGTARKVRESDLRSGKSTSCGCRKRDLQTPHGIYGGHPLYTVWDGMCQRVRNKNRKGYMNYGGRGVSVCVEWLDAGAFVRWALAHGYAKGLELDRENNDRDYCPENCRFVPKRQNILNSRLLRSTNTSGYRGVSTRGRNKDVFVAQITVFREHFYLGSFQSAVEAAHAYDNYILDNRLDYYPLNFPNNEEKA